MLLAATAVGAAHAALEVAEEILDGIGRLALRADMSAALIEAVVNRLMRRELAADGGVKFRFVGVQFGRAVNVGDKQLADAFRGRGLDMERPHAGLGARARRQLHEPRRRADLRAGRRLLDRRKLGF